MKKIILSLILTVSSINLFGWELNLGLNAGMRVGMNFSNIVAVGDDSDLYKKGDNQLGFNIGLFYDWQVSESFYIQPGVSYTTRGSDYSDGLSDELKINYLQVPLLASYRFTIGRNQRFALNCGPTLGYAISGKRKYNELYGADSSTTVKYSESIFDDDCYNRFELGFNMGLNYYIKNHYINISWERGLTNLYSYDGVDYKLKNNNLMVAVGYTF